MIIIKSPREIELIKQSGLVLQEVFLLLKKLIKPGVTTGFLNQEAEKLIVSRGGYPSFKGYGGFKYATCISVNDTLIHGFPSYKDILKEGDIVSIDVGVTLKGYITDACRTFYVGHVSQEAFDLVEATKQSFFEAMKVVKPGNRIGDISHAIQAYCESKGYSLPTEYSGHGTGIKLHEDPNIPNVGRPGTGPILQKGMVLAIEPMVCLGKKDTHLLKDGWTVKTKDGKICSHYENTIVVTEDGYEIVTLEERMSE